MSYLNIAVLIGTLSLALFNASKDQIARNFAYVYAVISVVVLVSSKLLCSLRYAHTIGRFMDMLYINVESP